MNRNGTLDVYYGDAAVYRGLALPAYAPFSTGRFGWGARTGGSYDNHWVDDVKIALNTQPAAGLTSAATETRRVVADVSRRWQAVCGLGAGGECAD